MRRLRVLLAFCVAALLLACRPPAQVTAPPLVQTAPSLQGQLILPEGYQAQASASQVRSNATVTLIDPTNFQAKGTGVTAGDGTFTVQAVATFTPAIGGLYLLESSKTLGGAGSAAYRLRTLVQFTATGWTSVTGSPVQLSTATTAVALLWDHHGLTAADVLSKVSYDATTRTHRFNNLSSTLTEAKLREVETLVHEALLVNVDPIQAVRPDADGRYGLSLVDSPRNKLVNPGFEVGNNTFPGWTLNNPGIASFSVESGVVYEGKQSLKLTVTAAGDTWYGQGWNGTTETYGLPLATGTPYTFSVYARGAVGGEKLAMCLNYQTPFYEIRSTTYTLTTSWQRYTWTFVSGYTTDRAFFILRNGNGIGQATFPASVYVDGVQFEEGGAATDFAPPGNLLLSGFANSLDSANLTPTAGKIGRGVMVDHGLNVLPNSSFETDSNSDGLPDGMSFYNGSGGTYSLDPEALFHAKSWKIAKATQTADYCAFDHTYNYKAGKTYTFSVWVKGDSISGSPNSDFGIYVDPSKTTGGLSTYDVFSVAAPTGTFGWTRISYTKTFLYDCNFAKVIPIFRNKTGTVWFDGFQIEENTYASPYAGDGPDRLIFDAKRFVNPHQGTIAFWYKPTFGWDEASTLGTLMAIGNSAQDIVFNFAKTRHPDGRFKLLYTIRAETPTNHNWMGTEYLPTAPAWKAGEWHHIALTWGPGGMVMYLDGASVATQAFSGSIWTTSSAVHASPNLGVLSFAGNSRNFTARINGALDDLKIWDVQKSAETVQREFLGLAP